MGKTAKNEIIKLTAAFFNNIGVGLAIAGVIVPIVSLYQGGETALNKGSFLAVVGVALFWAGAFFMHWLAKAQLENIRD